MSKVIHLSDDAHAKAKVFCKENSLRMSEWVASLIQEAIAHGNADPDTRATVPQRKILKKLEDTLQTDDEGVPVYAAPPFWKDRAPKV